MATILQSSLLVNFLYPLLLIFFLVFAVLEKTGILGKDKKQLNALLALVVGLIFVAAVFPKIMVENLVLYLSVALIIIFVGLMLWGFISGNSDFTVKDKNEVKIHKIFAFLIVGSLICVILWASGIGGTVVGALGKFLGLLFKSGWSGTFWTNFIVVAVILLIVCIVVGWNPFAKKINMWITLKK